MFASIPKGPPWATIAGVGVCLLGLAASLLVVVPFRPINLAWLIPGVALVVIGAVLWRRHRNDPKDPVPEDPTKPR